MDGEVQTLLADIESLVSQLKQVAGNNETPDGNVEMAEDAGTHMEPDTDDANSKLDQIKKLLKDMEGGEPDEDDKDKSKNKVEKSDEGAQLDDKAEGIIDELPEETKANIKEVAKAIDKLLGRKSVQKSQSKESNEMSKVLKAIGQIADRLEVHEKSILGVYQGLGIADEIKKSANIQPVVKERPRNDPAEFAKSLAHIQSVLGITPAEKPAQDKSVEGRFSLKKALTENDGLALTTMLSTKQK